MQVVTDGQVLGHLRLVHQVVNRIHSLLPNTVDYDDLFQAGVIGLIAALKNFNPALGHAFSTYAVIRIRGHVFDDLRARDWVPRGARERSEAYRQTVAALTVELGRPPADAELADALGLPVEQIPTLEYKTQLAFRVSFDAPLSDDHDSGLNAKIRDDPEKTDPARRLERDDQVRVLTRLCTTLTEQERMVIRLYYFEGFKMKEIAVTMGVTESRICQIHGEIIKALRRRAGAA